MKVLVCGGREYRNRIRVFEVLDGIHAEMPITLLIHGACVDMDGRRRGADALAELWALSREVPYVGVPAKWKTGGQHRKREGHIRNQVMYDRWRPDRGVAFPGGNGTRSMVDIMRAGGTQVLEVDLHDAA